MFNKYERPDNNKDNRNNEIISLYKSGTTKTKLSKKFNISRQRVSQIVDKYSTLSNSAIRAKVFSYCQDRCVICHTKIKLQIHHIDNNSRNNLFENLVVVCNKCHKSIHAIDRESRITKTIKVIKRKKKTKKKLSKRKHRKILKQRKPSIWDIMKQSDDYKKMIDYQNNRLWKKRYLL